jgi:hypothetical protein
MAADPEIWKAFIRHLEEMIERLKRELAPYEAKIQFVYRMAGGEKVDITAERTKQIEREIQSLRNTLARVQEHDP